MLRTWLIINTPTMISAGAVAADGTTSASGAMNRARINKTPVCYRSQTRTSTGFNARCTFYESSDCACTQCRTRTYTHCIDEHCFTDRFLAFFLVIHNPHPCCSPYHRTKRVEQFNEGKDKDNFEQSETDSTLQVQLSNSQITEVRQPACTGQVQLRFVTPIGIPIRVVATIPMSSAPLTRITISTAIRINPIRASNAS